MAVLLDSGMKCMTPSNVMKVMEMVRPMLTFLQKTQARRSRKKVPVKVQRPQIDETHDDESDGRRNTQNHKSSPRNDPFSIIQSEPLTVMGVVKDE